MRDAARAVRLAKKVVTARPESANYRNTLGVAYYRNGDDRAAVAELERAMSMQAGGNSFDWFFLAMAHWRLGDRNKARTLVRPGRAVDGPTQAARRRAVPLSRGGGSDAGRPRPALTHAARSLPVSGFSTSTSRRRFGAGINLSRILLKTAGAPIHGDTFDSHAGLPGPSAANGD